ncbi:MAG: competence/damage-inducible protein A [Oscillospiraceae bacterium]|jgi:nicotinamide-nucleotide amidase|nr:competence/damage-inducible protein A [Oscillospiraceae bacterium]
MAYIAEIIGVGTELLLGNIVNTDARDVSQALSRLGINVYFHTVVGDNPERLKQAVAIARARADIIITTGGLGPTYDDLTKQTLAEAFGKQLLFDEKEAEKIRGFFRDRLGHLQITENNFRQAMLPEGCVVFDNGCGTAPGCAFESDGKHVLMLPGPPRECRAMIESGMLPYLKRLAGDEIYSRNIHVFGLGESAVEARLRDIMESSSNPTLAPYAKDAETTLRVTARAKSREDADALMNPIIEHVKKTLGDIVYGVDTDSLENTVISLLRDSGGTLAVAESCTGGLLAKRLTDIPGASRVFLGGITAYSDDAKIALVGVPRETLEAHGAVSRETAEALALGAREKLRAGLGIGITGVAGPGADEHGNPEGRVFISLSAEGTLVTRSLDLYYDRERIRIASASHALDMARRHLTGVEL